MGRLKLFDGQSDDDDGVSKISINREFAKRYEHNKKREELQRYEELKKQGRAGSDPDASSSEDDDVEEELIKPIKKRDFKFFDALLKVKNGDPILREKDAKLFDSDSDESEEGDEKVDDDAEERGRRPMYLKDVVSKHLIEAGPEFSDEEEEMENVYGERKGGVKSYSEEQEELRKEFLKAVEEGGNDGGEGEEFLRVKDYGGKDEDEEEDNEVAEKLDKYFGEDEKLDEDTKFLKDYFRNKMWIDGGKDRSVGDGDGGDGIEFSEDEEELEKQEDYERGFNFRFEENAGDRLMGHSRKVEGSVRKKDNARKSQRERKEERMLQAEFERKEELKRLKNLKRREINEKLEKIREVAGIGKDGDVLLDVDDLEEEFDPVEYDKKMKEAFGNRYYETEDPDPGFGSGDEDGIDEKPDFDQEDELLGLPKGWDEVDESRDGFMSARQRILKSRVIVGDEIEAEEDGEIEAEEDGDDGGDEPKESKRKRKRKPSEVEKAVREQLMEEYYKLDYEDTIGDLKTRFKYKPVKANRYRLKPEDILTKDDKELNQIVSLKKLAPYRDKEWKVHPNKIIELKQNSKIREGEMSGSGDKDKKKRRDDSASGDKDKKKRRGDSKTDGSETDRLQNVESNGDVNGLSRKSKRRRSQAELKLSRSRLDAYGKTTSKRKSKNQ